MEVNTGDEEGGSKKVKLTLSHDDEHNGQSFNRQPMSSGTVQCFAHRILSQAV
jgi:hypothetical protein